MHQQSPDSAQENVVPQRSQVRLRSKAGLSVRFVMKRANFHRLFQVWFIVAAVGFGTNSTPADRQEKTVQRTFDGA
jgi:hypothetical protein